MDHKDTQNMIFLLGGHDLEMLVVRCLLDSNHIHFEDAELNWSNACLSAYANILDSMPEADFYGLELQEDYPLPKNYYRIDHHNDYNDRPASILQLASFLGIEPDHYLLLVAANDAGYIPAMQALGATDAEIADIRRQDRAAQGVTDNDEMLAEKSIAENLTTLGDLLIVRSLTSHFSPICDRLFPYQRLLIYTDNEWVFYGDGKAQLVSELSCDIASKRVYHGGGDNGYIGATKNTFTKQQILGFVNKIKMRYERY